MFINRSTKIFVAIIILFCLVLIVACGEDSDYVPAKGEVDIGQNYSMFTSACSVDQPDTRVYTNTVGAIFVYPDENC